MLFIALRTFELDAELDVPQSKSGAARINISCSALSVTSELVFHISRRRVLVNVCEQHRPGVPLHKTPGLLFLFRRFPSDTAISPPEKQQWFAIAHHDVFYLRDKDGVIAGILR
jgi:hypothetical protein